MVSIILLQQHMLNCLTWRTIVLKICSWVCQAYLNNIACVIFDPAKVNVCRIVWYLSYSNLGYCSQDIENFVLSLTFLHKKNKTQLLWLPTLSDTILWLPVCVTSSLLPQARTHHNLLLGLPLVLFLGLGHLQSLLTLTQTLTQTVTLTLILGVHCMNNQWTSSS